MKPSQIDFVKRVKLFGIVSLLVALVSRYFGASVVFFNHALGVFFLCMAFVFIYSVLIAFVIRSK